MWKVLNSKLLIDNKWIKVFKESVQTSNNFFIEDYYTINQKNSVNIVAYDLENQIILNNIYRHGSKIKSFELPCGLIDSNDETPESAAKRELLEETGYLSEKLIPIGEIYSNPAFSNSINYCFLALGCKKIMEPEESSENHEIFLVDEIKLEKIIEKGEIIQSMHIAAFYLAKLKLKN
jgi:ADP-ribose pyrophosphatase